MIRVPDAERGAAFFGELLGWRFEYNVVMDYYHVDDHAQPVAMGIAGVAASADVACYFRVADVELARVRFVSSAVPRKTFPWARSTPPTAPTIKATPSASPSSTRRNRKPASASGV